MQDLYVHGSSDLFPITGQLEVDPPDVIPDAVDLSHEGTVDWAHCGYMNVAGVDDRRANGPDAIVVGATAGNIAVNNPYTPTFSWSDGAPTASATTQAGIFLTGAGRGLTVTVPATTSVRTLRVYVDVFNASAQLSAHLSDASAPDYVGQTISANDPGTYNRFTIRFKSASAGQTLKVSWTMTADRNGSIALLAATLY